MRAGFLLARINHEGKQVLRATVQPTSPNEKANMGLPDGRAFLLFLA
jgi:hypothetical protein